MKEAGLAITGFKNVGFREETVSLDRVIYTRLTGLGVFL